MPTKKTKAGREYEVDGKRFTWHPLDENDETGAIPDVVIPLRLKLGIIYEMAGRDMDAAAMTDILEAVAPKQSDTLREMDLLDFQDMFTTWQAEYNSLSGASLGESSASPA